MINFLNACKNLHQDKEIIITACGPSLNNYKNEIIDKSKSPKVILICIKQSYNCFEEHCDYHVINTTNSLKYKYLRKIHPYKFNETKPTVILGTSDVKNNIFMDYHYLYEIQNNDTKKMIAAKKNLRRFHLNLKNISNNKLIRNWGPGVMYEFVLPFAFLLGSKKITTYGWEISDKNHQNTHFYDLNLIGYLKNKLNEFIFDEEYYTDRRRHNAWNYFLHKYGFIYNKAKMFDGEAVIVKSFRNVIEGYCFKNKIDITFK